MHHLAVFFDRLDLRLWLGFWHLFEAEEHTEIVAQGTLFLDGSHFWLRLRLRLRCRRFNHRGGSHHRLRLNDGLRCRLNDRFGDWLGFRLGFRLGFWLGFWFRFRLCLRLFLLRHPAEEACDVIGVER
jgi:hypothetical protein